VAPAGKIVINGIETRALVLGEGPPLLMVHGWGANIKLLEPLALRLSRLGHQCYMFDLPGFGESAEPPAPFSTFDYAAFCLACLDHYQLRAVNYFGHSFGGRIGLILGSDHSDRVQNLALSNSAGIKTEAALPARMRLSVYKSVRRRLQQAGAKSAAEGLRAIYNRRYGSEDFQAASPVMRQTLIKILNQDLLDNAKRVAAPTILIWGDEDQETPLSLGRTLEAAIPDAALLVHEGAGHYAYLDFPEKTASIMDALFRGR
jgi:pimeloyl-ACP methyl ester carboxylesterase